MLNNKKYKNLNLILNPEGDERRKHKVMHAYWSKFKLKSFPIHGCIRKSVKEEDCQKSLRSGSTNGGTVLQSRCIFCDKASNIRKEVKRGKRWCVGQNYVLMRGYGKLLL